MSSKPIKTAFILGAGLGTRLCPMTDSCPKPLLPVGGRPIITYAMEHLLTAGVERFIINTHHMAHVYHDVFPENKWRETPVIFRYEPVLLDTAGGLKNIEDLIEGTDDILVYNGDVISDLPLAHLLEAHRSSGAEVTLVLRSKGHPLHVAMNDRLEVCDFRNTLGKDGRKCLFTGIYALQKKFLDRLDPDRRESVITVFLAMIKEKTGFVAGVIIDEGSWQDVGSLEEYKRANDLLKK
jgi:NDP-sugar pyrophosphorylase family protein